MAFENRRMQSFFRVAAAIAGGLILLNVVFQIVTGFGYAYFVVNDVFLHWVLTTVGICLLAFAVISGSETYER